MVSEPSQCWEYSSLQTTHNNSSTVIDNIVVYNSRLNLASILSIIIGLSDHVTEILKIENTNVTINKFHLKHRTRQ
jgi:hypothetical protein